MSKVINYIAKIGYVAFGILFLYSIGMLFAYNVFFNLFPFEETIAQNLRIVSTENSNLDIYYSYQAKGQKYHQKQGIYSELFYKNVKDINKVKIYYNGIFPSICYIENIKIFNKYYVGICFSLIGMVIIYFNTRSRNMKYWEEKYKEFFDRL